MQKLADAYVHGKWESQMWGCTCENSKANDRDIYHPEACTDTG